MKNTVVLSFGRMNPMTNGHEKLADKIKSEASKRNADAKLYLSHSTNPKKDPLDFNSKVKFAKKAFGPMVQNSAARTIIEVAKELTGKYDNLVVVVGSDRIPEFKTLLNKYNGKDFTFKSIEIISAGERDPDAEGVTGMSGSKMRGFVASDDFESFKQGVPSKLSDADAKALFTAVKKGMKLSEELELDEAVLSYAARRDRAQRAKRMARRLARARVLQSKRFADTGRLKSRAVKMAYKFFRTRLAGGKDYASLGTGEKMAIDKRLQKSLPAIKKFAVRLLPQERKLEIQRKQSAMMNVRKESIDLNVAFTNMIAEKVDTSQPKTFKTMFAEAQDKKQSSRLDTLVRMGLADKALLSTIKRAVGKLESGDTLSQQERTATNDLLTTLLDMVLNSDQLFRLTRSSLQKEEVNEAAYEGNIGAMEMMKFFQKATPGQKAELKKLIADKKKKEAWQMVQQVTGVKLVGKEFREEYEDEYDDEEIDGLQMAKIEVANLIDDAEDLLDKLDEMDCEPEAWVSSKITRAVDYIGSVRDYLEFEDEYEDDEEEPEDEYNDDELDAELMGMEPSDFGDAYEDFKPIIAEIEGLMKKAERAEMPYPILKEVYNRGIESYDENHRVAYTPQQWAFARVNSFITKSKGTWEGSDKDLAEKVLEWGTDKMRKTYAKDTPEQPTEIKTAEHCCDDCKEVEEGLRDPKDNPCWKGYKPVGTKIVKGKTVPNCVPVEEEIAEEVDWEGILQEAEYQGKKVELNNPFRTPDGPKKFAVYTMGPNGKVVIVRFGDPNMEIKRDDPERRASYRARHGCDNPGPKWKANYWSCYQWRAGAKVDS